MDLSVAIAAQTDRLPEMASAFLSIVYSLMTIALSYHAGQWSANIGELRGRRKQPTVAVEANRSIDVPTAREGRESAKWDEVETNGREIVFTSSAGPIAQARRRTDERLASSCVTRSTGHAGTR